MRIHKKLVAQTADMDKKKLLKKIRRWEEEFAYASPERTAVLTGKIARLKTKL